MLPPEEIKQFLADRKIVVADESRPVRVAIAKTFSELGATGSNVKIATDFDDAVETIARHSPHIVVSDYHLGKRCGLELVAHQRRLRPDFENLLFILITSNASQSAVAEAAEGDVDAFLLKPFTGQTILDYLVRAIEKKRNPGPYQAQLQKAKEALLSGDAPSARALALKAKGLEPKPSLACYYQGQAHEALMETALGESAYEEGRGLMPLHYRCSLALFDLCSGNNPGKAYSVIRQVSEHFPISAHRLGRAIELAVRTQNFEDISRYYEIFIGLDERREELRKLVCAGLVVAAVSQLRQRRQDRGIDLLQKATVTAAGNPAVLKEIVLHLVHHRLAAPARLFLGRFPADSMAGAAFLSAEFAVQDLETPDFGAVISRGRSLIQQGVSAPEIYRILIARSRQGGLTDAAEALLQEARDRWPTESSAF